MRTINNIATDLSLYAVAHDQINSFLFGIPPDKDSDSATEYPQLWAVLVSSQIEEDQESHDIEFIIWDQPSDENNKSQALEVLSDTKQIANDTVAFLRNNYEDIDLDLPVSMEPVYEAGEDGCYGWKFTLKLKLNQGLDYCTSPISSVPDQNTNVVRVRDRVTGEILYTVTAPNDIFVEELRAIIDTINNNTTTIIDPID